MAWVLMALLHRAVDEDAHSWSPIALVVEVRLHGNVRTWTILSGVGKPKVVIMQEEQKLPFER